MLLSISWLSYVTNICHRMLGFVLLCSLAAKVCSAVLWPSGMYGLPMPKTGCPKANGFYWKSGYIFQDLEDVGSMTTVSPNSHLQGWVLGDVVQYYCIKNNASAAIDSKRFQWPAGEYCIYRKGATCPTGLLSGSMLWDDENGATGTNMNMNAGVLPDGVYNQDTKIFFCCQTTGSSDDPIELPVASPFYLIAFTPQCQEVQNTIHTTEYIAYDTEDDKNHDQKTFPYPYGASFLEPTIHYCYYKECAWTMTALAGTFWSPYYPQDYKSHASCKWRINVPWNYTISITFEDVALERTCCRCDYVEVWETLTNGSAVLIGKFCDDTKPDPSQPFRSSGNNVTVIFHSDATVQDKGFNASYQAIPVVAVTTTSTSASTANSNATRRTTTTSSHVTTTAGTNLRRTSKATTLYIKQNDTTTTPFTNMSTRTPDTTTRSSDFTKDTSTTDLPTEQHTSTNEPGKSTATEREGLHEARNGSAPTGNAFVIIGVIASLIVIGGAVAGTLYWFCKKRNMKRSNHSKSTLAVNFTSAEKTVGISNISSWDMYQGKGFVSNEENGNNERYADTRLERHYDNCVETVKESDNPMYGRECLETSVKDGYEEIKESENPLYASSVKTVKESENPMYESMDDKLKGNVDDGIYSALYERMV
ncbi:uncharacterized protein LOC144631547 isoform X2 [Oculina patagonica]